MATTLLVREGAMCPYTLVLAASLIAPTPAIGFQNEAAEVAQSADDGNKPAPTVRMPDGQRQAVPRASRPAPQPAPAPAAVPAAAQPQGVAVSEDQRRNGSRDRGDNPQSGGAVQRGDRPRGDNPATGRAVPREFVPAPARPQGDWRGSRGTNIYVAPPIYNYYYYPRRYYPYGYGAFGLGYFYYDPYTWYPPSYYRSYYGGGYGSYGGFYHDSYFDIAEVRLAVSPRFADVYVDGYYAGGVNDFDGLFQRLKLEAGVHHIQITAPGYLPLDFDVRLNPGQKITYRGELRR